MRKLIECDQGPIRLADAADYTSSISNACVSTCGSSGAGVTSTFTRRNGKLVVRTDGPDSARRGYEVTHTFGTGSARLHLYPVQQVPIRITDRGV
jgi:hypothetical protein